MALELVGAAFLTVAFEKLFKRLSSEEFVNLFRGKKSVNEKLKVLTEKLKTVRLLLGDAEDRQVVEPSVKEWLDDLKDVIFKVDDLVEEITEEAWIKSSESNHSPSRSIGVPFKSFFTSSTKFDRTVEADVIKFVEDLNTLRERADVLELKHGNPQMERSPVPRPLAPLREESSVFGRDDDKRKILDLLLSSDDWGNNIGVLPIVGMGGLGKTTLAQLVYNDDRVKEHKFELKAWVTVSTEFDVFKIIKSLLQQIGSASRSEELEVLQQEMKEALRGKKFLFVLDDVWDENYQKWDLLKSNFAAGHSGSKIILTTRSKKVCSITKTGQLIYELKLVSDDDSWKLFIHHAFDGDLNDYPELHEIGKRIVEKCKGLPLAVQLVGGLLRCERNLKKWETILKSQAWSRDQTSGVLPSLWLSYQYLPSPLKQCFAYCAVFPQDYRFNREDLVLLWMAEGFLLPGLNEKSLEEVGDDYFEVLVSRSFFQRSSDHIWEKSIYVMHDLVHDLATFVLGQFCLSLSEGTKVTNISSKTRYLYCDGVKTLGEATYLHSYYEPTTIREPRTYCLVKEIVEAGRLLRVLSTRANNISEFLCPSKNHLKHLRYLNLSSSDIEEVPDSVCTLYNLQTLVLSNCRKLSTLPSNLGNLINLRHLNNSGCYLITKMPPRMGNLKELRTLTDFALGGADGDEGCSSIKELGELPHLAGELRVRGLQNVETADDARKANLIEKSNLLKLVLEWGGESSDTRREWEVLDALQPHTNMEELTIRGYAASSFPKWVGDSSFSKMVSLTLKGSISHNFCSSLPPLGQLPSLKKLEIEFFKWVESIGSEFYGGSKSPFPCLETLTFADMETWKEWSFVGRDGIGCFPRLKELRLMDCPNLRVESFIDCECLSIVNSLNSVECFSLDKYPRLKSLYLIECPKLKSITLSCREDHKLTYLRIWHCPEMESLFRQGGLPSSLESLWIEDCRKLVEQNRHWGLQRLTSLTSLTIKDKTNSLALDSFPQGLLPTSLTSLELEGFENLKTLNGTAFEHLNSLQNLNVFCCDELESLPEQALPQSLRCLSICHCRFLERRFQKDKGDHWHCISHIPLIYLQGRTTRELEEKEGRESQSSSSAII